MKDLSMSNRGSVRRDKKMPDATGTWRWVPYKKWEAEVIMNPMGLVAQRAKRDKDPDLEKIKLAVLPLTHTTQSRRDLALPPLNTPIVESRKDLTMRNIGEESAKRMGFRNEIEGKGSKQKVRIKDDGKKGSS